MKGISKILSASVALVGLRGVYSNVTMCYDGQNQVVPQPSQYLVMPPTQEGGLVNCNYPQNGPYYVQPPTQPPTTPTVPSEPEVPSSQPEDIGTCTVTMTKHCDNPEPQQPVVSTTTQTVMTPPPAAPTVIVVPPEQPRTTFVVPQKTFTVTPPPTQSIPGIIPGVTPSMVPGVIPQTIFPNYIPGVVPPQPNVPGVSPSNVAPGLLPGMPSQIQPNQCICPPPQSMPSVPNPMPIMPTPISISGNGYPSGSSYTTNIGQGGQITSPCVDLKPSMCEPTPGERAGQFTAEACVSPTPTVVIGNHEYLVGPSLYQTLIQPSSCSCPCPSGSGSSGTSSSTPASVPPAPAA